MRNSEDLEEFLSLESRINESYNVWAPESSEERTCRLFIGMALESRIKECKHELESSYLCNSHGKNFKTLMYSSHRNLKYLNRLKTRLHLNWPRKS